MLRDFHVPFVSRGNPREFLRRIFWIAGLLALVMLGVALEYDWGPSPPMGGSGSAERGQPPRPSADSPKEAHGQALRGSSQPAGLAGPVIRFSPQGDGGMPRTTSMLVGAPTVDANGMKTFVVLSVFLGAKPITVRVLEPSRSVSSKPRRILYVLPVDSGVTGLHSTYSDGLEELRQIDVHNRYNVVLVAPSFHITPWYGDHPTKIDRRLESFIVKDLVLFGDSFAAANWTPQRWLIGFSKSATGALSLILRHPAVFSAVAAWDGPVQFTDMSVFPGMQENFGTEENFDRYEIPALVMRNAAAFRTRNRIWISGDDSAWTAHMVRLSEQMARVGVRHTFVRGGARRHHWASGWLEGAVAGLDANAAPDVTGSGGGEPTSGHGVWAERFAQRRLSPASTGIWVGDVGWNE